jgi:hypothetical protein
MNGREGGENKNIMGHWGVQKEIMKPQMMRIMKMIA